MQTTNHRDLANEERKQNNGIKGVVKDKPRL